jgi:hypothetical protein
MKVTPANVQMLSPEYYLAAAQVLGKPGIWQYATYEAGGKQQPLLLIIKEASTHSGEVDHQILAGEAFIQVFTMEKHVELVDREPVEMKIGVTNWERIEYGMTPIVKEGQIQGYTFIVIAKESLVKKFTDAVSFLMGNPSARISDYPGQGKEAEA